MGDNFYDLFSNQRPLFRINITGNCSVCNQRFFSQNINRLQIYTDNVKFEEYSLIRTNVDLHIEATGSIYFDNYSFDSAKIIDLQIKGKNVEFAQLSFDHAEINGIDITAKGTVTIADNAFRSTDIDHFTILSSKNIIFGYENYSANEKNATDKSLLDEDTIKMFKIKSTEGMIGINSDSFKLMNFKSLSINAKKGINIKSNAFSDCEIEYLYIETDGPVILDTSMMYNHLKYIIKELFINSKLSITIETGIFSNIDIASIVIHSTIWVGESDSNESAGAIFVYGRYYQNHQDSSYISGNGAQAYIMTLKDFKDMYSSDRLKLKLNKKVKLYDFINLLKSDGKLTAKEYNWPTNNCQHFTARCLNILHATRQSPNENDWMNWPKPIMSTLELYEKNKK